MWIFICSNRQLTIFCWFLLQTEAPILIRPFLEVMTKSEIAAVMICGFATIAGGVLAAYIEFGVSWNLFKKKKKK